MEIICFAHWLKDLAWHNLPSQETFQVLSHERRSQLPSFRVFLFTPKGKILL